MCPHDNDIHLFYPMDWQITPRAGHDTLLAATLHWSVHGGVVQPGSSLHRSLSHMRSDLATVLAYPSSIGDTAQLISDFIGWYLLVDDHLESVNQGDLQPGRMSAVFERFLEMLFEPGASSEPTDSGLLAGAMDLGTRFRALASTAWLARFRESMRTYFYLGVLPEIIHRMRRTLPSPIEYVEIRVDSSGSYPIFDLIEIATGDELPEEIAAHPLIRKLRRAAAVTISWANDVLSFHKEGGARSALNLPHLLMADCGLTEQQALNIAVRYHNAEMRYYLSIQQEVRELAALDCALVRAWMHGLDTVMRGLLEWQLLAARYTLGRSITVRVADRVQETTSRVVGQAVGL